MKRKWWVVGIGVAAALALVGAGVVMAQTPTPGASGSSPSFLDRVAQKLGIETPKLKEAVTSAANDQIDAEVASGKLTQDQANKLKQAIANGKLPGFGDGFFGGPGGPGGHGKGAPAFGIGGGVGLEQIATFLNITQDQLRTELQAANATLATVAQAHGKSRDQLKTFITQQAKTRLDQAVSNGKLTQQQEDAALTMLTNNLDSIIDRQGAGHGKGFGKGPGPMRKMPAQSGTPGAGTGFPGRGPFGPGQPATSAIDRG